MLSSIRDSFISSFPICMPCISFSCHIAVARTSSMILNQSGDSEHPYLAFNLRGKASTLSLLSMMLAVSCVLQMFFTRLRKFPSIPSVLRVFPWMSGSKCILRQWKTHSSTVLMPGGFQYTKKKRIIIVLPWNKKCLGISKHRELNIHTFFCSLQNSTKMIGKDFLKKKEKLWRHQPRRVLTAAQERSIMCWKHENKT